MIGSYQKDAWQHTSSLMALLYNINRGKHDKARTAEDFNPFTEKKTINFSQFKQEFKT